MRRSLALMSWIVVAGFALPSISHALEDEKNTPEVTASPGNGVTVKVGDVFSLNIRSRFVLRYQLDVPPEDARGDRQLNQTVSIATTRFWFSGNVFRPELTYMIQLAVAARDYRDGATSPIYDAYLDWKLHRDISLRAGQYFVPFDRIRTVREWALQMAERAGPISEFTLDRDVGVTAYSDHFLGDSSPVAWRVGLFGGGGNNLVSGKRPGALAVARIEYRPLGDIDDDIEGDQTRRTKPALALGLAGAVNVNTNRVRSTTGPTWAFGTADYVHLAADLTFKWRGAALQAEYLYKYAGKDAWHRTAADGAVTTNYTRSGHAFIVQASYLWSPPFEVVARWSRQLAKKDTDPAFQRDVDAKGQELGAGVNYYLNGHRFKFQGTWLARMPSSFDFGKAYHSAYVQLDATF